MDLMHPRCAGLDVSKRDAKVCVRCRQWWPGGSSVDGDDVGCGHQSGAGVTGAPDR